MLEFDGGSISGAYTLTGTNTGIISNIITIFKNVVISGSWLVDDIFSDWFDSSDETISNTVKNCLALNNGNINTNIFINGDYPVYPAQVAQGTMNGLDVASNTHLYINGTITKSGGISIQSIFSTSFGSHDITISGGNLVGDLPENATSDNPDTEYGQGLLIDRSEKIIIENVSFSNFTGDGIYLTGRADTNDQYNNNIVISGCNFDKVSRNGISVIDGSNITIYNCRFSNIRRRQTYAAIDIEPNSDYQIINNVIINNIVIKDCTNGILANGYAVIDNVRVVNCSIEISDYNYPIYFSSNVSNYSIDNSTIKGTNAISHKTAINGHFKNSTIEFDNMLTGTYQKCTIKTTTSLTQGICGTAFDDCTIDCVSFGEGTSAISNDKVIVKDCKIITRDGGFNFFTSPKNIVIENNIIDITATYYPFNTSGMVGAKITNNIFNIHSAGRQMFSFSGCDNIEISNNIFNIDAGINQHVILFTNGTNNTAKGNVFNLPVGFTSQRYAGINAKTAASNREGDMCFDGNKPIWWNGSAWVDATGATV